MTRVLRGRVVPWSCVCRVCLFTRCFSMYISRKHWKQLALSKELSRLFWSGQKGQCFRSVKLLDPKSGSRTIFYVKALAHKGTKSSRGRRKSRTSKVSRAFLMCYLLLQQEVLNPLCDVSFSIVCWKDQRQVRIFRLAIVLSFWVTICTLYNVQACTKL